MPERAKRRPGDKVLTLADDYCAGHRGRRRVEPCRREITLARGTPDDISARVRRVYDAAAPRLFPVQAIAREGHACHAAAQVK